MRNVILVGVLSSLAGLFGCASTQASSSAKNHDASGAEPGASHSDETSSTPPHDDEANPESGAHHDNMSKMGEGHHEKGHGDGASPHGADHSGGHGNHKVSEPHGFKDAEKWAKVFESPERDAWQKPDEVIAALKLDDDAVVIDLGAGTGYFAVRLAKAVSDGMVFGVDIESSMVNYLENRVENEDIPNLQGIHCTATATNIDQPADMILIVDTYHHLVDRVTYLSNMHADLREGGRVVVIDFRDGELPVGPPPEMRVSASQVEAEFKQAGYTLKKRHEFLPYQYMLEFVPPVVDQRGERVESEY